MIDWIDSHRLVFWGTVVSIVTLVATILLLPPYVARLPADYFVSTRPHRPPRRHPVLAATLRVLRNMLGAVLVAGGVMMLVLPGQGLLTILVGLTCLEFPGKFRLERALVRRGPLLRMLNWVRRRHRVPPLLPPE